MQSFVAQAFIQWCGLSKLGHSAPWWRPRAGSAITGTFKTRVTPVLSLCPALLSLSHTHDHSACHLPLPGLSVRKSWSLIPSTAQAGLRASPFPCQSQRKLILSWLGRAVLSTALPAVVALWVCSLLREGPEDLPPGCLPTAVSPPAMETLWGSSKA